MHEQGQAPLGDELEEWMAPDMPFDQYAGMDPSAYYPFPGMDPYAGMDPNMDPGMDPYAGMDQGGGGYAPSDPYGGIDPSTGLPWGQPPYQGDPTATAPGPAPWGATLAANTALAQPMQSEADFFHGGIKIPPQAFGQGANAAHQALPPPIPNSQAVARMPLPTPARTGVVNRASAPIMPVRRNVAAHFGVRGYSVAGDSNPLSSLTNIIGKIAGGDDKTQQAVDKQAAQKPGGNDQLVNDIVTNVVKYLPLVIMAVAGYGVEDMPSEHLFMLARKRNKAAVAELAKRAHAGDVYSFQCVGKLLGLNVNPLLMHEQPAMSVQGMPWRMAMDDSDEFSGYNINPYGGMGPWGMGSEIWAHGDAPGPYFTPMQVGADVPPEYIDDAVNQTQATLERLMAAAENGNPTAIQAVKALYEGAKSGNPRARAIVMLTARTPAMPYVGASEKHIPSGRRHKRSWYQMGLAG